MKTIHIKYPIWKTRSVGVNIRSIVDDLKIYIDYKLKSGDKLYPGYYTITKEKALSYPYQMWKGNKLHIIPIVDMELHRRVKKIKIIPIKVEVKPEPLQKELFLIS